MHPDVNLAVAPKGSEITSTGIIKAKDMFEEVHNSMNGCLSIQWQQDYDKVH